MAKIETCEGGVTNLASSSTARLENSSLKDSKGVLVIASVGDPINEDVVVDGNGCVIKKLLGEAKKHDRSEPCPECRRVVNYRSKKIRGEK